MTPVFGSVAFAEQQTAMEYGIPSFVISDKVWEANGRKAPAFSCQGQIYLRERLQERYRGMLVPHESTHVMKQVGFQPYLEFVDRTPEMLNMNDNITKELLETVASHRNLDLFVMSDADSVKLYDEFNATMYGHIAAGHADAFFGGIGAGVFKNYNAYVAELTGLHEQFKRERNGAEVIP